MVAPQDRPRLGLNEGYGCIGIKLLPKTKTCRMARADQYISFYSSSGLSLGTWLGDLQTLHIRMFGEADGPVFQHLDGT